MLNKEEFKNTILKTCNPLPGSTPYPTKYRLPVKKKYEGYNVIDFFLEIVPRSTKDIWLNKIEKGTLLINGKPAQKDTILKGGYITEHQSHPKTEPDVSIDIDLIYIDDKVIVINKPAPLPMHPSGRFNKNSLVEILKLSFPHEDFKIIHRLDANTTGVAVLARDKKHVEEIGNQFQQKTTIKKYVALVEGIPKKEEFTSKTKIGLEKTAGGGRDSSEEGIDALTHFKILTTYPSQNQTLLEVTPHTGRTNQIRLHLAKLGHPIVGDIGYKDADYFKNNPLTYDSDCLFLHAWKLTLKINEKEVELEAPIPSKFKFDN